jgi:RecA-family ATPase
MRQLKRTWLNAPVKKFDDVKPKQQAKTSTITARELNNMEFPRLEFVVPDLIVEGLTLFAGRPKIGKSWMKLQIANAVANGIETLGGIRCRQGDVLYCALEDNPRRIQARMDQLKIADWSKRLHFCFDMPRLDEGGLDFIRAWIAAMEKPRLVVIDTFKRVRPMRTGASERLYDADYNSGQELADLCRQHNVAVVIVHHDRKADAEDPFDTIRRLARAQRGGRYRHAATHRARWCAGAACARTRSRRDRQGHGL